MSQSRSLDDLVPSTLTSSRNLASLRNFAIYEDSDFNWSTFQDVDIIEEDPDWPRFGQFYKRMRHRNTAYALNESGFFTHQDWGLENKTKYGNVMGRTPLLKLISNYTYEEYGLPDKKAEKRLRASQRPTSILNRDSIGDISTGIGYVPRPTTVTHSDYLDTLGGVRLGYTQSKDSLTPYIDRKSTTFTESQTLCLSQGSDSASKL